MNSLLNLRKKYCLTQQKAATALGVSLRTYQRYEQNFSDESKKDINILKILENSFEITESKGILSFDQIKKELLPILEKYKVSKCYLFGSYSKNTAKENSDIDLLIDTDLTGLEFFAMVEEIRVTLHKKVDVLRLMDISETNPISLTILKEGILIYGRK